ncbi:hypothetical protein Nepgr_007054 [Nepenthes gracilis]|uniref:Uncharacterized protein n=1 Tax=Nepenthes gracilis TaxID=150966 RepID=A0AAD3S6H1_NEPGR|nr:hypothetical protein Nepgr_007054 [Nepenthes gracilis]
MAADRRYHQQRRSFPFLPYTRILKSESEQPLLIHDHDYQREEQQKIEIESDRKRIAVLEKSRSIAEKEIARIKSTLSNLETAISTHNSKVTTAESISLILQKELIDGLKRRVSKLEQIPATEPIVKKQEDAIEKLKKSNADLKKDIAKLSSSIYQLQSSKSTESMGPTSVDGAAAPPPPSPGLEANELLLGCFIVMIFLICVLIGNRLYFSFSLSIESFSSFLIYISFSQYPLLQFFSRTSCSYLFVCNCRILPIDLSEKGATVNLSVSNL